MSIAQHTPGQREDERLCVVEGQEYGADNYSCYQCDSGGEGFYRERTEPTHWWLGLDPTGQAHYACTGCAPGLFNVRPVRAAIAKATGSTP